MIKLTRLNNKPFAVNSDLIKFVDNAPDTVITLTSGDKVVVKESVDTVIELVVGFKKTVLSNIRADGSVNPIPNNSERG